MSQVTVSGSGAGRTMDVSFGASTYTFDRDAENIRSVDFLLAALGSCTLGTIRAYTDRKGMDLPRLAITLEAEKDGGADHYTRISVNIDTGGGLDEKTRRILYNVSQTCTIHKTLHAGPEIEVEIA